MDANYEFNTEKPFLVEAQPSRSLLPRKVSERKMPIVIPKMIQRLILICLPMIIFSSLGLAIEEPGGTSSWTLAEKVYVALWDRLLQNKKITWIDIKVWRDSAEAHPVGVRTIGEAMMVAEQVRQKNEGSPSAPALISAGIEWQGTSLGELKISWVPSGGPLSFVFLAGLLLLDRAFLSPQWIIDFFPQWFGPSPQQNVFHIQWTRPSEPLPPELFSGALKSMSSFLLIWDDSLAEEEVTQKVLTLDMAITHFKERKKNQNVFVLEWEADMDHRARCRQRVLSGFNPLAKRPQEFRSRLHCEDGQSAKGEGRKE